jgi:hypothetical protein
MTIPIMIQLPRLVKKKPKRKGKKKALGEVNPVLDTQ